MAKVRSNKDFFTVNGGLKAPNERRKSDLLPEILSQNAALKEGDLDNEFVEVSGLINFEEFTYKELSSGQIKKDKNRRACHYFGEESKRIGFHFDIKDYFYFDKNFETLYLYKHKKSNQNTKETVKVNIRSGGEKLVAPELIVELSSKGMLMSYTDDHTI